ncbi:hypothetical protein BC941DRAFT_122662 [Chlamydoabsidia padenii]|nr:hypothetical protein BC941DRAFT_122662 [Chlamydoabsidia padenii]
MPQSKTTPNYDNKNAITPDYDLYPSLNRHLINGDILSIPPPPVYHQIEVVDSIGRTLTPTPVGTTNLNSDHLHEWDLYPSVLRKVRYLIHLLQRLIIILHLDRKLWL